MIYSDFKGLKLSMLGMGTMRLPCHENGEIDKAAVSEMVAYAMKNGVNYYDTAWGYHGGKSETVMGEVLSAYPRDSFYLASKFPGYDLNNMPYVEKIFEEQLVKCKVDYFDFYLIHNVCEMNIEEYLDPKFGIYEYLMEQKRNGRIKHLGFSAHAGLETLRRFLEAYGKDMEFGQLQLNFLDWEFQNAKGAVDLLNSYGIPVWVMEPLRGGKLARLEEPYAKTMQALRPDESLASIAFRFIQSVPTVKVVLSGMSNLEQITKNIDIFSENKPLDNSERAVLTELARDMTGKTSVRCTACRYCVDHCPQGLDIPELLELYNEHAFTGGGFIAPMALSKKPDDKKPSACIGCRSCEAVCPQKINIADTMADFCEKLK